MAAAMASFTGNGLGGMRPYHAWTPEDEGSPAMRHFTIRRLMLAIAVVAVVLGGLIGLASSAPPPRSISRIPGPSAERPGLDRRG